MRVAVRSPLPQDMVGLYLMHTGPDGFRTRIGGTTPSFDVFQRIFWDGVLVQNVVEVPTEGRIAGLVSAYAFHPRDRTCFASLVSTDRRSDRLRTMLALGLLIEHLMTVLNVRKIYFEVPEFNAARFQSSFGRIINVEARLENHYVLLGRTWAQFICSVSEKEFWGDRFQQLLEFARS